MRELLIGCGNNRARKLWLETDDPPPWDELVTCDIDPECGADVVHDLNETPWPFPDNEFHAIHAFEILEHIGQQGDYRSFFAHFHEIWRILKPDGRLFATVPGWSDEWAWADPSHTRIISPGTLMFLSQQAYREQVGVTAMTDFRWLWKGDLFPEVREMSEDGGRLSFVLRAIKETQDGEGKDKARTA